MRNQLIVVLFTVTGVACGSSGTGGQTGGSSGATGGASGSGGASGPSECTWKGKTYSSGESFQDDCNTCTCGALGDTLVRCTVMACPDGGAGAASGGSSGTGGISASGGVASTGGGSGAGGITMDGGDIPEVGESIDTALDVVATGDVSGAGGAGGTTMDGGDIPEVGAVIDAASDAVAASACGACAADELCVAYYDGTCKPMQSTCNKVSAATRQAILVSHERCFATAMGDEICGTRDGQHFWGCGEPPCGNETLSSDINCYGP
jgi:uncharacterized protein YqgV (UPF0045/DUF77 family)